MFRYDINGMRAIAVIPVLLFHFNNNWVPGGFAGVDVFFVISGFLMTGIVFRGFDQNNFNLFSFYIARANRLIPALAVLCLFLLIFGALVLPPISYRDLAYHSSASLGFFSNIAFWKEAGYFDTASYEKWLLHTWSLSVEWQFYIIYPLVLQLTKRILTTEGVKRLLLVGTILCLVFSIFASMKWTTSSYYLLPTRAWEMMMGGLAYAYPWNLKGRERKFFEILGLCLILVTYILATGKLSWPGWYALAPVIGTYFVIIANRQSSVITNNIVFQIIGKWSYTIYLWHWPIVVFFNSYTEGNDYVVWISVALIAGGLGGFLDDRKTLRGWYVFVYCITLVLSLYVLKTDGASARVEKQYQVTKGQFRDEHEGHMGLSGDNGGPVWINSSSTDFDYIVYGDSKSRHYNSFFFDNNIKVASLAIDGCSSTKNSWKHYSNNEACKNRYATLIDLTKNHPGKILILSPNLTIGKKREKSQIEGNPDRINEMKYLIEDIGDYVSSIYVIGLNQGSKITPFNYLAESSLPFYRVYRGYDTLRLTQEIRVKKKNELFKSKAKELGYTYIDPSPALCNKGSCYVIKNGKVVYTDNNGHLSKFGAELVGKYLMTRIKVAEKHSLYKQDG